MGEHAGTTDDATGRAHGLAQAALAGDRRALGRLLTAVESRGAVGEAALRAIHARAGRAHLVGVTGAPGSGKSTLVAALTAAARDTGRSVAVIAVDPSSPITGGALLGDRVRMQQHAGDEGVFIRSMAARGHAGGLAATTVAAAMVLDAAGFEIVFIETVGTGQSEVEVAAAADTTVVLEAPEMGDEVQAIKAGLLEVADIVVVNKGDRPGAQRTAAALRAMLSLGAVTVVDDPSGPPAPSNAAGSDAPRAAGGGTPGGRPTARPRRPEVLITTATDSTGVVELLAAIDRHRAVARAHGRAAQGRAGALVWALLVDRVRDRLLGPATGEQARAVLGAVASHELDPYAAADRLLEILRENA